MSQVQTISPSQGLNRELGLSVFDLLDLVWPSASEENSDPETILAAWREQRSAHFLITNDEEQVLAHALIFRREVVTEQGPLGIGALAAVCVHPAYRGHGWGADVVRAAFDYLPELGVVGALFQTGVPDFYRKLGARRIDNRFFNGQNPADPFWEEHKMVYPASFSWPAGAIDLNGPGF